MYSSLLTLVNWQDDGLSRRKEILVLVSDAYILLKAEHTIFAREDIL